MGKAKKVTPASQGGTAVHHGSAGVTVDLSCKGRAHPSWGQPEPAH